MERSEMRNLIEKNGMNNAVTGYGDSSLTLGMKGQAEGGIS
jgi:hypothetical protein